MEMFDNYPQTEVPNNRCKCFPEFHLDIMTGETASHTFEIPFNVKTDCLKCEVLYKLGIKLILQKSEGLEILETDKGSVVTCKLSAQETALFGHTCLDAKVQLRFTMNNGAILYSDIYNVSVTDSLWTDSEVPPVPIIVTGFGWTED